MTWIQIEVPGSTSVMPAYVAQPDGDGPFPAIVILEEIFGVNSYIRSIADRLAAEGYVAIAPDIYHREVTGLDLDYSKESIGIGRGLVPKLSYDNLHADIESSLGWLRANPAVKEGHFGCIGFCIGGHIAYMAAATSDFKATASFYGTGITTFGPGGTAPTVERTSGIKGKIVCFFGAEDEGIPQAHIDSIRTSLETYGIRHEVVVYPNSGHGFFCDQRGSYNPTDSIDAWERVKKLFTEELKNA